MKYFHQMLSIIRSSHIEILSFIRAMMAIASAGRGADKEADGDEVLVVRRPLRVLKFCSCTSSISMIIFGVSNSRQPFRTACDKARRSTSPRQQPSLSLRAIWRPRWVYSWNSSLSAAFVGDPLPGDEEWARRNGALPLGLLLRMQHFRAASGGGVRLPWPLSPHVFDQSFSIGS